ncbi:hypothetical protein HDU92_003775 [Lobulomyces angularis]|nr:hypothetical protein HDU92_003775 [Lobulomyces angularis]
MEIDQLFKAPAPLQKKRKVPDQFDEDNQDLTNKKPVLTEHDEKLKQIIDAAEDLPETIDLATLKKLILKFEKAITKNNQQRSKFQSEPLKFIDSEVDLDQSIKELMVFTAVPELYPKILELGALDSLLSLVIHENTDISVSAIDVLNTLIDEEVIEIEEENDTDSEDDEDSNANMVMKKKEGLKLFVNHLMKNNAVDLLIQNINRLNEFENPEDRQAVFNSLSIIESITAIDPTTTEKIINTKGLLKFFVERLKVKNFDSNKAYCVEILNILLNKRQNILFILEFGFMDIILKSLSKYIKKDPPTPDEVEFFENLFNTLCLVLQDPVGKLHFIKGEGIELMIICLKNKKMSRIRSLKALNFSMLYYSDSFEKNEAVQVEKNEDLRNITEKVAIYFLENFGLKTLFPIFLGKGQKTLRKEYEDIFVEAEDDEHCISIISSLFRSLYFMESSATETSDLKKLKLKLKLKFYESRFEKFERLLNLITLYKLRLNFVEEQLKSKKSNGAEDIEEMHDDEGEYLKRLDSGLFILQKLCFIFGCIFDFDDEESVIRDSMKELLSQKDISVKYIMNILEEYKSNLDVSQSDIQLESDLIVKILLNLKNI